MNRIAVAVGVFIVSWGNFAAAAGVVLNDSTLEGITAGSASAVYRDGKLYLDVSKRTNLGTDIDVHGSVEKALDILEITTGSLQLDGEAQSNLRALVNTNAVNSPVQVLINLNINVNSHVDVLNQINSALQQQ